MTKGKKVLIIITILTLCFIWGHSLVPSGKSAQESEAFTAAVVQPVQKLLTGKATVIDEVVRKWAHMAEYCALGIEIALLVGMKKVLPAFSYCGAVALMDETIQLLTGRGALIKDVWIDLLGATVGLIIALTVLWMKKKLAVKAEKRNRKE